MNDAPHMNLDKIYRKEEKYLGIMENSTVELEGYWPVGEGRRRVEVKKREYDMVYVGVWV